MVVHSVVNSVMSSMTYVLSKEGCDHVWLVDCGDVDKILEIIGYKQVQGVLLTHAHYDHFYGLPRMLQLFPKMKVFSNSAGIEELQSPRKNLSLYLEDPIEVNRDRLFPVNGADKIVLFDGLVASVFETPGHSPSCLTYAVMNYLFTGDAFIPGIPLVTNLPDSDKQLAKYSKQRIESLLPEHLLYPGHMVNINNEKNISCSL